MDFPQKGNRGDIKCCSEFGQGLMKLNVFEVFGCIESYARPWDTIVSETGARSYTSSPHLPCYADARSWTLSTQNENQYPLTFKK